MNDVIRIIGARERNLRDGSVRIPVGVMTAVTGVAGSGKSIKDALDLPVSEAHAFFRDAAVAPTLARLVDVGLGYAPLGQLLGTLSDGEPQRLKLVAELEKSGNLYILDEPTTGLHMSDIARLIRLFDSLVEQGNTVIVIEHNLDIIARADWILDMGPGVGHDGGTIVFEETPDGPLKDKLSLTGCYLRERAVS